MVRQPVFTLLKAYLQQASEAVAGLDFYADVVKDIEKQKANVLAIYNEFKKQIEDKDYLGKLTVQEQHALGKNELNYKKTLREMDDTISKLMLHKWAQNTRNVLFVIDDTSLVIDDVLSGTMFNLTDVGQAVKAKRLLHEKKFQRADYNERISSCQTMLNIIRDDVLAVVEDNDPNMAMVKFNISIGIGKAVLYLQRELEDREANGAPELFKFNVPEVIVPELPDAAPEPEKKEEVKAQLEVKFPDKE